MYMAYTTNPHLPRIRMDAVKLVRAGFSTRAVARHLGFNQSTVVRWCERAPENTRAQIIATGSSRPHHHPHQLSHQLVDIIIQYRLQYQRCSEVIHHLMIRDGYQVSLSSVKRTLCRQGLIARSPWKRWHQATPRPVPQKPGILVEIDTIHIGQALKDRFYIYTLLDVCTRWAHAVVSSRINTHKSFFFVYEAQQRCPVRFQTLQSDHGQEFSTWFTEHAQKAGYTHRHSRVRTPTDNGHLERFNRTLQEECFRRGSQTHQALTKVLPDYLHYYNHERPHLGLHMQTPLEVMQRY